MKYIVVFLFMIGAQAFANEGGGHEAHGVPKEVLYQAINLILFIGILVYFLRAKVRALFVGRFEEFTRVARETEQTRKNLEFKIADLIRRTEVLAQTSEKSLKNAKIDAEKVYLSEMDKTHQAAARADKEVDSQIHDDQTKLIEKLRTEALDMSIASAEEQLGRADGAEKSKITKQFNQRVEGAVL
jgi:F0F1-type ATP synthase membrane subunit b/b'